MLAGGLLPLLRCPPTAAASLSTLFPDGATLFVAGPAGGSLDRVADGLLATLRPALAAGGRLQRVLVGAADGVTGANRFETQVGPDGSTALVLPGVALLACLVGDPRARFDAGRLIPVLAATAPGVLMSRLPLAAALQTAALRVSAARPDGQDLPGLLALDLLGTRTVPVFGPADPAEVDADLSAGRVDAALVVGPDAAARSGQLAQAGLTALCTLGVPGPETAVLRDPAFPDVPTLADLLGARASGPLFSAWQATAVCAQLSWLLALLSPTPAAMVALWRRAAAQARPLLSAANEPGAVRLLACPAANAFTAPSVADPAAQAALHRWLAERLHWQPA